MISAFHARLQGRLFPRKIARSTNGRILPSRKFISKPFVGPYGRKRPGTRVLSVGWQIDSEVSPAILRGPVPPTQRKSHCFERSHLPHPSEGGPQFEIFFCRNVPWSQAGSYFWLMNLFHLTAGLRLTKEKKRAPHKIGMVLGSWFVLEVFLFNEGATKNMHSAQTIPHLQG